MIVPNTIAPRIVSVTPTNAATLTNLTAITVTFSEPVHGVDPGDLRINGNAATNVTGSGTTYTFRFPQPPYGSVAVAVASGHGITDFGYPADLPYNELGPDGHWQYDLIDRTAPVIAARTPAAGSTVTNLTQISVTFSEPVTNVDASDLIVGGIPAFSVSGSGASYTFVVGQPADGTINVTWSTNHGITDLAAVPPPNPFNGAAAGWSFSLDSRAVLIRSNATWKYVKGLNEASDPSSAWRQLGFDDSLWTNSLAPFVFGEPTFTNSVNPGTDLRDMTNNAYNSIYLRREFVIPNANNITNLWMQHRSDDGFIAWINGVEVFRYNMPAGDIPYNGSASSAAPENNNNGVAFIQVSLTNAPAALVSGTNILAVHAFNVFSSPPSTDFAFDAQLYTFFIDTTLVGPRIARASPAPGDILYLTNITVTFSEEVTNVHAEDLLVNGVPATNVVGSSNVI